MSTADTTIKLREYSLSIDKYSKPTIFKNEDAVCMKLIQLILLEKGTYPTRPDMGFGIVSRYRYTSPDNLETAKSDLEDQINTYLPELDSVEVDITMSIKNMKIAIIVDKTVYRLVFDSETKTLSSL